METNFKIVRLLSSHIPGAIDVLRQSFFPDERVCNCVRILQDSPEVTTDSKYKVTRASKELEDLAVLCITDGVSFCAVDTTTDEVLGVALNKIQVKPKPGELSFFEKFNLEKAKEESTRVYMQFMIDIDGKYDLFGQDGNCYFEVAYLAVKSTNKGRGIGTALVTASSKLAQDMKSVNGDNDKSIDLHADAIEYKNSKALKYAPKNVSAIFTSRFSQKCGARSGYAEVLRIPYTEFQYRGKMFSETTGPEHPFATLSVKTLL